MNIETEIKDMERLFLDAFIEEVGIHRKFYKDLYGVPYTTILGDPEYYFNLDINNPGEAPTIKRDVTIESAKPISKGSLSFL